MYDLLYNIDLALFNFLNRTISNPFFDKFFPFITDVKNWYIAFIILWLIAIFKGGRIGKISAVGVIVLIVLSDQISSHFLKPLFERIRPCNVIENVHLLVNCTKSYSMPSSHAVNNFAVAIFFSKLFPKLKIVLLTIASLVALSRPIVGVHYFFDIFVGAIIGSIIGYLLSLAVIKIDGYFENKLTNK
ncbi:MAG: phosphatase PAP2 family protein [Bacteroidetes bacterium]|nr:phosphatase PAP2 family protein [Bacteroidota bacterium]MBU1116704.1 phosphatase PAP2 family protein [Bacteroidota bacterium]MBU1800068.1 phosphatase PAP2 family protein [Bacteroidota bacterium]